MITAEELAQMKARAAKATPGPWMLFVDDGTIEILPAMRKGTIARLSGFFSEQDTDANADFIAIARMDVPRLIREVEELRAALRGLIDASFTFRERATEGNTDVERDFYRAISMARAVLRSD